LACGCGRAAPYSGESGVLPSCELHRTPAPQFLECPHCALYAYAAAPAPCAGSRAHCRLRAARGCARPRAFAYQLSIQRVMAARSYVCPSAAITGSRMSSHEIGHSIWGVALERILRSTAPAHAAARAHLQAQETHSGRHGAPTELSCPTRFSRPSAASTLGVAMTTFDFNSVKTFSFLGGMVSRLRVQLFLEAE